MNCSFRNDPFHLTKDLTLGHFLLLTTICVSKLENTSKGNFFENMKSTDSLVIAQNKNVHIYTHTHK